MEKLKRLFVSLGYNEEEIEKIINTLDKYKAEALFKNVKESYEFLKDRGYSEEEVLKMTKTLPKIYSLSIEYIRQKIEDIKDLGYTEDEVIKIKHSLTRD